MKQKKYLIISFAIIGAALITSTAFIQPVQAKVTEQEIKKLTNDSLGDYLYGLLTDEKYLENMNTIYALSNIPGYDYFRDLKASVLEYIVEDNDNFNGLKNKLTNFINSDDWKNMPLLSKLFEELEDDVNGQQILDKHNTAHDYTGDEFKSCFTFKIKKQKESSNVQKNKFINQINKLTKNYKIFNQVFKLLNNKLLANKLISVKTEDTYNLIFNYKGEDRKVIEEKPVEEILSFTSFLDIFFESTNINGKDGYSPKNGFRDLNHELNIKDMANELENLPDIMENIASYQIEDGRTGQDVFDELLVELKTNEEFIQIGENIANAVKNNEDLSEVSKELGRALKGSALFGIILGIIAALGYTTSVVIHFLAIGMIVFTLFWFICYYTYILIPWEIILLCVMVEIILSIISVIFEIAVFGPLAPFVISVFLSFVYVICIGIVIAIYPY